MKAYQLRRFTLLFFLLVASLVFTGCDDNFYLSEKEVAAYNSVFINQPTLTYHFDNLSGRAIDLTFDNSTGTPRLQTTNLLTEMRRTELANLEIGGAAVSLDRLCAELEAQIGKWIEGKLQLYTSGDDDRVKLTQLNSIRVIFLNNPSFTYNSERQTIAFDVNLQIIINGTIEVNAVNWLIDLFANVNGTYPITAFINNLRLQGDANIYSPYSNAGRIRFQLTPQILSPVQVGDGNVVPHEVLQGVAQVLTHNLSVRVDEIFEQEYNYFALSQIRLTPQTAQTTSRLEVAYRSKYDSIGPDAARPLLHMVTRASDGKLYHSRKHGNTWSDYSAVPFPNPSPTPYPSINNDPILVHSGGNQLELAATNQSGDLVYAHYRDEAWGNQRVITPNTSYNPAISYRGKPALAASAPGQAEIITAGSDGNLWHHRRINGVWLNPARLPLTPSSNLAAPYRDPTAVYVGNKIVVVFADGQNRLWAIAFDLETSLWGQPTPFTTSSNTQIVISYAPTAVASGEDRVDVVYVKYNSNPNALLHTYHRVLRIHAANFVPNVGSTGISFINNETTLSACAVNDTPVLTSSTYKQPELFVRAVNNRICHYYFVNAASPFTVDGRVINPGWQGVLPSALTDSYFSNTVQTDGRVSEFSAAATRTGKTEIVARGYVNPGSVAAQYLFHNSFASDRYARTPWKTVHWRGWEAVGLQQFLGRPALAAVDVNFEMAFVGNWTGYNNVHFERLAETNQTDVLETLTTVRTASMAVNPIILSTGTGIFDLIAINKNGNPTHIRRSGNSTNSFTLTIPAGVNALTAISAVSYGNGFIELAARGTDSKIYHWRYREGAWSQPVSIATNVISAPVLLHTGAGQFELLGIDLDYKLFRWRFVNNAWQPRLSVASNFRIHNLMFAQASASSWGDGSVDIVVVGADTRALYHRRIGPGDEICNMPFGCPQPRTFSNLGSNIMQTPILTAFSPTKLNILTMQNLKWHSTWSSAVGLQPFPPQRDPLIQWSQFKYIGGDEMIIGSAAHSGQKNFAAVAVKGGRFYINRNAGGQWTGFQPIIGQSPEQIILSPVILPALAAHGG